MTMEIMNNTSSTTNISNNTSSLNQLKSTNNQIVNEDKAVLQKNEKEKSFDKIISETFKNSDKDKNNQNKNILSNNNANNKIENNEIKNNEIKNNTSNKPIKTNNLKASDKDDAGFNILSQVETELLNQTQFVINNIELISNINELKTNLNKAFEKDMTQNVTREATLKDTEGNVKQISMTIEDVEFFANVVDANLNNNNNNSIEIDETTLKSAKVSNALLEMLNDSKNTGRPVRVDFDNNISVVMQVTKDGKLNARFYPGDKAAEEYLRQNIQSLRNQLDSKEIEYDNISYKERNNQNNNKNKRQNQNPKEDN